MNTVQDLPHAIPVASLFPESGIPVERLRNQPAASSSMDPTKTSVVEFVVAPQTAEAGKGGRTNPRNTLGGAQLVGTSDPGDPSERELRNRHKALVASLEALEDMRRQAIKNRLPTVEHKHRGNALRCALYHNEAAQDSHGAVRHQHEELEARALDDAMRPPPDEGWTPVCDWESP